MYCYDNGRGWSNHFATSEALLSLRLPFKHPYSPALSKLQGTPLHTGRSLSLLNIEGNAASWYGERVASVPRSESSVVHRAQINPL